MSPIRTARPYAAKAIVEHEFDTDHLNVWIIFRFSMNTSLKPGHGLWVCEVDDVEKAVTASTWLDSWTLRLTVPDIASIPDRVTLEYKGPSELLTTTWNKQWEPWGPILSSDGSLLPYGGFFGNEIIWQQAAAQDVWYTISDAAISAGPENKIIFQNNQETKIAVNGFYIVHYYITVETSIANKHVLTAIEINGVEQGFGQMHHHFGRANEEESWGGSGIFNLSVDDLISVGVATTDAGNPTLTVDHLGLTIHEFGKT